MLALEPTSLIYVLAVIQVLGLASACLARMGEGSIRQTSCQRLFFGCLAMVGAATMTAMLLGPGACLASGATMAVMVLTATWDFGGAVL
ncbi:MAG TPA: hypothetical protein VN699_08750 [Pirellulales bacterium]|jgi:hypothetical protein|nr:hypothetical protein [Pirellulales bacterium]